MPSPPSPAPPSPAAAPLPSARTPDRLTALVFAGSALGLFAYEATKTALLPTLTLWESHAVTIAFGSVVAALGARRALGVQARLHERVLAALAERSRAEAQAAASREGEARFRQLVEQSPEAIVVHAGGALVYANPACLRLLGASALGELPHRTLASYVHPDDRARALDRLADLHAGGGTDTSEYRLLTRDGAERVVDAVSVAITHAGAPAVQTVLRDVTERARLEAELAHQALHDALTGLPNRALFRDRVAHALDRAARDGGGAGAAGAAGAAGVPGGAAVLFVDLDDFKAVNDGLGHAAGDAVLVQVARRLLGATRGSDTVARLGGDEFAVLLEGLQSPGEALAVVARVGDAIRRPLAVDGRELTVSATVGLAHAGPGDDADTLVRHADVAMYEAKAAGKARHAVFAPAMYTAVRERFELEAALRRAADDPAGHGFTVVYQPVVELATGVARGAEALLRWQRPGHGPVSPAVFVPVAEGTGAIHALGRWVLAEACRQLAAWHAAAPAGVPPGVAVNISGRQLEAPGFVGEVTAVLAATGAPAAALTLEITESVLMQDADATLATLGALKALGVRLAIDDFGTGYSSLRYLQQFPVDVLKIDKSFVDRVGRGGTEAALARTVIALGATLGVRTVAEGVEDPAQREALCALGCDDGQGYLFARPAPAADVAARWWPADGARAPRRRAA